MSQHPTTTASILPAGAKVFTLMNLTPGTGSGFLAPRQDAQSTWVWTLGRSSTLTFNIRDAGVYGFSGAMYLPAPGQTAEIRLDGQYLAVANSTILSQIHAVRRLKAGAHELEFRSNLSRDLAPEVDGWAWSDQDVSVFVRDYTIERLPAHPPALQLLAAGVIVLILLTFLAGRLQVRRD